MSARSTLQRQLVRTIQARKFGTASSTHFKIEKSTDTLISETPIVGCPKQLAEIQAGLEADEGVSFTRIAAPSPWMYAGMPLFGFYMYTMVERRPDINTAQQVFAAGYQLPGESDGPEGVKSINPILDRSYHRV